MKRIKKIYSAALALILVIISFAGCTAEKKNITDAAEGITAENQSTYSAESVSIAEQPCFSYEGLSVTAKSMEKDIIWGEGVKIYTENNSSKNLNVSADAVIVNNCMISSLFSVSVAAGMKDNSTLYLSSQQLEAAGIQNIGQIEIYFRVFDSSSYETLYESGCVVLKTSSFDSMDTNADETGTELYNENGIRIVGKYVDQNSFWGASVLLFIRNDSGKNVTVTCDDLSVNGFMVTSLLSETVYAGKYSIGDITLLSTDLEENGIESIDRIELKFRIYAPESFETIAETESIGFSAK